MGWKVFVIAPLALLFLQGAFASCARETGPRTVEIAIGTAGGGSALVVAELAITDEERARGLMFRTSLDDGKGMLFVFETDQVLSFWMMNTIIPLSIAFIASDGRIMEIRDMEPLDLTPVVSARPARYALEVPRNWFYRAGARVGDFARWELD